jgi:hypothetical protein
MQHQQPLSLEEQKKHCFRERYLQKQQICCQNQQFTYWNSEDGTILMPKNFMFVLEKDANLPKEIQRQKTLYATFFR